MCHVNDTERLRSRAQNLLNAAGEERSTETDATKSSKVRVKAVLPLSQTPKSQSWIRPKTMELVKQPALLDIQRHGYFQLLREESLRTLRSLQILSVTLRCIISGLVHRLESSRRRLISMCTKGASDMPLLPFRASGVPQTAIWPGQQERWWS